jgi:hypothetical protein
VYITRTRKPEPGYLDLSNNVYDCDAKMLSSGERDPTQPSGILVNRGDGLETH